MYQQMFNKYLALLQPAQESVKHYLGTAGRAAQPQAKLSCAR